MFLCQPLLSIIVLNDKNLTYKLLNLASVIKKLDLFLHNAAIIALAV